MSLLKVPVDQHGAKDVMKKFTNMAYSLTYTDAFEKAVHILYGKEFSIKIDLSRRMQFCCTLCSKEMNNENAMAEHHRSGHHQKNLDKKVREGSRMDYKSITNKYPNGTLQYMLATSRVKPVGIQMLEEYEDGHYKKYYKCNLCGAHGKLDTIYNHAINNKHTEKYIKSYFILEHSVLTGKEREKLRQQLVLEEGIHCSLIRTIRGKQYFPWKWEAEGRMMRMIQGKLKKEPRSPSRSRSSSPARSPALKQSRRSPSPCSSRQGQVLSSRTAGRRDSSVTDHRSPSPQLNPRASSVPSEKVRQEAEPAAPPVVQPVTPAAPPPAPVSTADKLTQKFDVEELMMQFNFIVKVCTNQVPGSEIKTMEDIELTFKIMFRICTTLYNVIRSHQNDPRETTEDFQKKLVDQKALLKSIMGYLKRRMEPAIVAEKKKIREKEKLTK